MNDKVQHLIAGALIGCIGGFILPNSPLAGSILLSSLAGVIKEIHDATGRGTVDVLDALATLIGGVLVGLTLEIIKILL